MGLDQYMYLAGKGPEDPQELVCEDGSFDWKKAEREGYRWVACSDPGEYESELRDLAGLLTVVRAAEEDIDLVEVRHQAGASPVARLTGQVWSASYKSLSFSDGTKAVYEDGAQPPSRRTEKVFLVWSCEVVAYWRKRYDLDTRLAELYGKEEEGRKIVNCGWHRVSPEMYEAMLRKKPGFANCEEGWDRLDVDALEAEGRMLAYHISY